MFSGADTSRVDRFSTTGNPSPAMAGISSALSSRPLALVTSTARPPATAMPVQMPMAASSLVPMTNDRSFSPSLMNCETFSPTSLDGVIG